MVEVPGFEIHGKVLDPPTGALYRATDLVVGRTVALKQIHAASPGAGSRLRSSVEVLAGSPHPNLVDVDRLVYTPDALWLVQEWVDGVLLDQLPAGTMNTQQAVATMAGVLHGLTHAHHLGIVHGDVCPATIVITPTGLPRLFDFGLSGPMGTTGIPSTSRFTSPESRLGQVLTPASDVYSAAGLLARLLSRTLRAGSRSDRPPVEAIPPALRPVLNQALTPTPEDRYPTAGDLLNALDLAAQRSFGLGWLGSATFATVPRQREALEPAPHTAAAG
ncbi:serine/threonine-protein kinase [Nocardioides marmorisolisilvae]|uniref:Serine/threonine protein kinase n=1 Tax=Nocardioides marmorisolisilvae TaxID=1542737 RepID=A0A3N0E0Y3_9ACTN|nr:serine/threonine-protein kinase [Nocardioides marmorisolisilvae]RNL81436.1 serine/threonine protein kinase [Nocardioides marmorisolisilvae]